VSDTPVSERVRLDKWLWAARFFKTRAQAAEAVEGGKVHVNGARAKPARAVRIGDELEIRRGEERFVVHVRELSERRGPASQAQQLYEETKESEARRTQEREQRRLLAASAPIPASRPNKQQRRRIIRFRDKNSSGF
jgi:ribosome-associated heat shock protein Hsp15